MEQQQDLFNSSEGDEKDEDETIQPKFEVKLELVLKNGDGTYKVPALVGCLPAERMLEMIRLAISSTRFKTVVTSIVGEQADVEEFTDGHRIVTKDFVIKVGGSQSESKEPTAQIQNFMEEKEKEFIKEIKAKIWNGAANDNDEIRKSQERVSDVTGIDFNSGSELVKKLNKREAEQFFANRDEYQKARKQGSIEIVKQGQVDYEESFLVPEDEEM